MAIRITRNENGNCINFVGSSQAAYWNACLSGEVNDTDATRINVINDIRTTDSSNPVYEFFGVPYTEFQDKDGNSFSDAATTAAYITAQANVASGSTIQFGATDSVNFSRDLTNTSILSSTGDSFGVNAIKAVGTSDGLITITENVSSGGTNLMESIRPNYVTIEGQTQAQTQTSVVNSLNALFTVTPVGAAADDVFASFTYSAGDAAMTAFGDVTDNADVATKGSNTGSALNDGIYSTVRPISANGEYFEFDNTGRDVKRKFVIGLKRTSEITSSTVLSDNTAVGEDMALAVRLKANATYEHSPYGAVIENGFYSRPQKSNKYRAGMDSNGRLFISHFDEDDDAWQVIVRSALITANEDYSLVIFLNQEGANTISSVSSYQVNEGSVTLNYRYIESPDGAFYYPLFATTAEAAYADEVAGGSGTYHSHTFIDELPSSNTWYMPSTGGVHAGGSAPSNTASITYSAISTGVDSNYAPAAFDIADLAINENTVINYEVAPSGGSYTVTASGMPSGVSLSGNNLVGTTPEVSGFTDSNPSDTFTITTTRTNAFGSATDNFVLTVNNTTVNTAAISGFTHVTGSVALVDSNTLDDGSAVELDDDINDGQRFHISNEFFNSNIIPALANVNDTVFIGFKDPSSTSWGSIGFADFLLGWRFKRTSAYVIQASRGGNGLSTASNNHNISGSTIGYDFYLSNKSDRLEATADAASNNKDNEPSNADGGSWAFVTDVDSGSTVDRQIVIATRDTQMDITLTGLTEYALPVVSSRATSFTKAVDFSGGEYLRLISNSNSNSVLKMSGMGVAAGGNSTAGYTSNDYYARPWATSIVFKVDGNNSNQYIWNSGEGTSSSQDNIYLRVDANRDLYFGWGRNGVGSVPDRNECKIATAISTSAWYGAYITSTGERLSSGAATAANLADCFDIRLMSTSDSFASVGSNLSTSSNWVETGSSMTRNVVGMFTIGAQSGSRTFYGKVASMVVTTLKNNQAMPVDAEIKKMITDPQQWVTDYKLGQTAMSSAGTGGSTFLFPSAVPTPNNYTAVRSTQVWLMGDGSSDSFSNGIRSYILPTDTGNVRLYFNSMVSNDIETVTIAGLS
jgi:hypothetical protein